MKKLINTLLIWLVAVLLLPARPAAAQAGSAADLINAVNAYRATNGLEAYAVDGGLMDLAQGQSTYQASIHTCTHQRADGSGPGAYGISAENVACGENLTVQMAVYSQWSDPLHTATMLSPKTGLVGAGVANEGNIVYYTLAVKRLSGDFNYVPRAPSGSQAGSSQTDPNQPASGPATSTPNEDGSIAHVVKYGDTLIQIATMYGISLKDLIAMNKLDPNKPAIFEHQVLIIRLAFTQTPYMTATYTPRPPTRTPLPTRTQRPTRTATPIFTPAPTRTQTALPLVKIPTIEELGPARSVMAYTFIGISALGLVLLLLTAFRPEKK